MRRKAKGLITASAPATMPRALHVSQAGRRQGNGGDADHDPLMKVNRTKSYGAEVVLEGMCLMRPVIMPINADEQGLTFVHPFDDLPPRTENHCHGNHQRTPDRGFTY